MLMLETIVLLVVVVALTNVVSHFIPSIPVSLFQLLAGLFMSLAFNVKIPIDNSWFMLLFVAPLLYNDAWRFPKKDLWMLRGPILANAIVLVFLTTILGGFFISFLLPEMPLAVAFALAAVISPTDPVAVQSIAKRVKLPKNVMHVVAGESLINDASGLVGFKTAVKIVMVGSLTVSSIVADFFWISIGGAIIGLILGVIISEIREQLIKLGMVEIMFHTLILLLSPFVIYWISEEMFHVSGVIAVVTAAIYASLHFNIPGKEQPQLNILSMSVWGMFNYLLNGVIFVLLGLQLPKAMGGLIQTYKGNAVFLEIIDGILIWFVVFLIRASWTYYYQNFLYRDKEYRKHHKLDVRTAIISGFTGVRGAVTMAAVMSVPAVFGDNQIFPEYNSMLFLAAVVVIFSLISATIMLPIVTHKRATTDFTQEAIDVEFDDDSDTEDSNENKQKLMTFLEAKIFMVKYSIHVLRLSTAKENKYILDDIISHYDFIIETSLKQLGKSNADKPRIKVEKRLRTIAISAEKDALDKMQKNKIISPLVYKMQEDRLNDTQRFISNKANVGVILFVKNMFKRFIRRLKIMVSNESLETIQYSLNKSNIELAQAAIKSLSKHINDLPTRIEYRTERHATQRLISMYRFKIDKIKSGKRLANSVEDSKIKRELYLKALNAQREALAKLYESHRIDENTNYELRQYINFSETNVFINSNSE